MQPWCEAKGQGPGDVTVQDANQGRPEKQPGRGRRDRSASTAVYEALRESIISLEYPPDTALSRSELARRCQVSVTPVREAILRLEQEGLVKTYPQYKTVVTRIDIDHLREAHFLRSALEIEVARVLAGKDPSCLDAAAAILDEQMAVGTDTARMACFARLDRAFHEALFAAAGQPGLTALLRERTGHFDRLRNLDLPSPGKMSNVLQQHQAILEAIRSGDPLRSAEAMRIHLSGTVATINELIAAHPELFPEQAPNAAPGGRGQR